MPSLTTGTCWSRDAGDSEDTRVTGVSRASPFVVKKRGIFPKPATNILRAWLFHNLTVKITKVPLH